MEALWMGVAFLLGFASHRLQLPPLVGYLVAGFALEIVGIQPDDSLEQLADVGILLLLFSIGLKLDLRSIAQPFVWGTALIHMGLVTLVFASLGLVAGALGVGVLGSLNTPTLAVVAFALSFSSTVFVIKLLDERDDTSALYGRISVGILIVQDLAAVLFIAATSQTRPSLWALALLLCFPLRPVLHRVVAACGHGELLTLAGVALTLGTASLFDAVGIKPDLGALVAGVLLGGHNKANELSKSLQGLKDIFLVGFFLKVGLTGFPTLQTLALSLALLPLVALKGGLFFFLMSRFRLRARTSLLGALSLSEFSEFGLIVCSVAVSSGWLGSQWLVAMALALTFSFFTAVPINRAAFSLYQRARPFWRRFESETRVSEERPVDASEADILVFGMGRVGSGAYDALAAREEGKVVGFDFDPRAATDNQAEGRHVLLASATDPDFWDRLQIDPERVRLVLLTMTSQTDNRIAIEQLRQKGYKGLITATARYDDDVAQLEALGADAAFHAMGEVGSGLAAHALMHLNGQVTSSVDEAATDDDE